MIGQLIRDVKKEISKVEADFMKNMETYSVDDVLKNKKPWEVKLKILMEALSFPNLIDEKKYIYNFYTHLNKDSKEAITSDIKNKIDSLNTWRSYDVLSLYYITIKQKKDDPESVLSDEEYFKLLTKILAWRLENTPYFQDGFHLITFEYGKVIEILRVLIGNEEMFEFEKDPNYRSGYLYYQAEYPSLILDKDVFKYAPKNWPY